MKFLSIFTVAASSLVSICLASPPSQQIPFIEVDPPVIDLDYEVHEAIVVNDGEVPYYNFQNIRYAEPPLDNLRFTESVPVQTTNRTQTKGENGKICIQAKTAWFGPAKGFLQDWFNPLVNISKSDWITPPTGALPAVDPPSDGESEDCLFLDVIVPQKVWDNKDNADPVPVLVWIYGGGFIFGDKSVLGTPDGLFARANEDVIYVAMNYRLGLYGFLAGPSMQREGGRANAGLYDQLLALQWVQNYIMLFGGDPSKVTVFGESAGAASILHQLTAFQALRYDEPPFAQAILQSPAFFPLADPLQLEETYETVLEKARNISGTEVFDLEYLRQVEPSVLAQVNGEIIMASNYGQFSFGPVPDSRFTPALPGKLLARGEFYHDVKIMVGHNLNEGILFTPPFVQDADGFINYINQVLPGADESILEHIAQLYPVGSNYPRDPARDKIGALASMLGDVAVDCNTLFLARAYQNATYSYLFSVFPAFHGLDTFYTYYPSPPPEGISVKNAVALKWQKYITNFAKYGNPDNPASANDDTAVIDWPTYGANRGLMQMQAVGNPIGSAPFKIISDTLNETTCEWWQDALYY